MKELWLIFLFLFFLFFHLSFSLVLQDAINAFTLPLERRKDKYGIEPLSRLFPHSERLLAVLSFSRLVFAVPLVVLTYFWAGRISAFSVGIALVSLGLLLYLLPEFLLRIAPLFVFRRAVQVISYVLYPLYWLMARTAPPLPKETPAEDAKQVMVNGEPEEEESEEFKGDILKAVSMIGETTVREVMTPRVDMVCIPVEATLAELHQIFKEHKFSRMPVYKEKIDNIVGIVSVMDLVTSISGNDLTGDVASISRAAPFVPETKKVFTLLRELRESHAQMAIVVDEYGGTSGLVTLEDLLEEIVGEIEDEYDETQFESYREKEGTYIVTGKFPIERMEEIFQMQIPAEDFETISGLVFSILGRIPMVGEIVKFQNLNLEILEADKRRIHRIRIRVTEPNQESTEVL